MHSPIRLDNLAPKETLMTDDKLRSRRRFIKSSAALGMAAAAAPVARAHDAGDELDKSAYGIRSRFVTSQRIGDGGDNSSFASASNSLSPIQDQSGIITPSALHFNSSHGAYPPDIDPAKHELMIHGLVDRPLKFTMADLRRLPFISRIHFIECSANYPLPKDVTVQHTHGKTSCSEWTGVPLSLLLKEAGVKTAAKWIVAEGLDRDSHSKSISLQRALDSCFLAYGQNGEPLRPHQGFPLRLMVPGAGGFSHVKWLRRIKVVDKPYLTPSERFNSQHGPKSVITYPSGGQQLLERGYQTISGLAWSGGGRIQSVEVSTDGGKKWQAATIQGAVLSMAHTRFSLGWNWDGKETTIMSRCTDEKGQTQPTAVEFARSRGVGVDKVLSREVRREGHWNLVFPWKVSSDGQVQHHFWV
jgi:sulfane dehydrogenase subunit SoxC